MEEFFKLIGRDSSEIGTQANNSQAAVDRHAQNVHRSRSVDRLVERLA